MIVVQVVDNKGKCERITGNPVITSLDGEALAPLQVILSDTWTDEDRAKFGIYIAEPFETPVGKVRVGSPQYRRLGNRVRELCTTEDAPESQPPQPSKYELLLAQVEALTKRIEALEKV